jgi:hypothetical protein
MISFFTLATHPLIDFYMLNIALSGDGSIFFGSLFDGWDEISCGCGEIIADGEKYWRM